MSEENLSINIWLAGRSYRIRIKPAEEQAVRKAVKKADDQISEMRSHYAGKDEQDFIAMTLLSYAADTAIDSFNNPLLQDELNKLITKVDKVLAKE
ncbi:MAG: cell division protein ZapA [Taibaiella sp.]|nr:cell division protein ZapA [Taibaiella sp.]